MGKGRQEILSSARHGEKLGTEERVWEFLRVTKLGIPLEVTFLAEDR